MVKLNRKQAISYILFAIVLCIARGMREVSIPDQPQTHIVWGLTQTALFVGLIAVWCVSVRDRIVQPQIRVMLLCVGWLMMFWHLTRGIKYHVVEWIDGAEWWTFRYLWYLYYLPLLLIPAFLIMIAISLRKPESYRVPKKTIITLISVSLALFLCVITNDLHQLVFDFPADAVVFTTNDYTRSILYYLCFAWIVVGSLIFFAVTLKRCRLPNKRLLWLPAIPIVICVIYSILYVGSVFDNMDFTTMVTFSLIVIFETTFLLRLVPSNNHYEALFRTSEISAIIADESLTPIYASHTAVIPDKDMMLKAVANSSVTENGMRLSAYRISGGYSFLEEDVTELYEAIEELEDVRADLKEEYMVTHEMRQTSWRRQSLVEKNHLYNVMQSETQPKVETLSALIKKLSQTEDQTERRSLAVEIALCFAYLKRRNNLILLKESGDSIRGEELVYCIRESLDNFRMCGAETNIASKLSLDMSFRGMTNMYDAFEAALEAALHETDEIFVALSQNNSTAILNMNVVSSADLSALSDIGFTVSDEGDGEWTLKYTVQEGGEPR